MEYKNLDEVLEAVNRTVSFMYEEKIDVHKRGIFGDTPLHIASYWGDVEAVRILLAAGAELEATGEHNMTPLFRAVMGNAPDMVELLLAANADPYRLDDSGCNVFRYAELMNRSDCLARLQKARKDQA